MRLAEPFHYALPVQERLFHEGLYVTHCGWEHILPGQPYPNVNHPPYYYFKWEDGRVMPSFCLAWVVEGEGEYETHTTKRTLKKGDVFLFLPGEWHRHRPDRATGWVQAWIEVNGTLPYRWWKEGAFGEEANFPKVEDEELFAEQFERLLKRVHAHPARNSRILSLQAMGIFSHLLQDEAEEQEGQTGDSLVDRAIEHIWNYSHGILDVPEIANHVGIGRRTLERRFLAAVGHSLLEEVQRCRFTRAARLLVETDLPVKMIVSRAGFGSHERMRLLFQKFTGMSPEAYRTHNPKSATEAER